MLLSDFDYHLPDHLIAQHPPAVRGASRLLHVAGSTLSDGQFADFASLLRPGDVMVFNDTRVIKARLFGEKASGGKVEALIERVLDEHTALAHVRSSKSPKPGTRLIFAERWEAEMLGREGELFKLRFLAEDNLFDILDASGKLPLPPYIERTAEGEDDERYQTVYAREKGAVAAPTAACTLPRKCWPPCKPRAWSWPMSPCMWAQALSSRYGWKTLPTTRCTAKSTMCRNALTI